MLRTFVSGIYNQGNINKSNMNRMSIVVNCTKSHLARHMSGGCEFNTLWICVSFPKNPHRHRDCSTVIKLPHIAYTFNLAKAIYCICSRIVKETLNIKTAADKICKYLNLPARSCSILPYPPVSTVGSARKSSDTP